MRQAACRVVRPSTALRRSRSYCATCPAIHRPRNTVGADEDRSLTLRFTVASAASRSTSPSAYANSTSTTRPCLFSVSGWPRCRNLT